MFSGAMPTGLGLLLVRRQRQEESSRDELNGQITEIAVHPQGG